ncbi:transmembrane protein 154 isoform X3 [Corythoichthys intestinalis]|uniref:transmembrane protein 154 isoform X3 n=1 Tax=Corythoichthys intestinalis TaxID=161448 RepID=UPI0025A6879F|nr:transmembrane protein 154 isoform X3 [Corythoichthys intestinalis]
MSAPRPSFSSMRGRAPLFFLLLWLLASTWIGTARSQYDEPESEEAGEETEDQDGAASTLSPSDSVTSEASPTWEGGANSAEDKAEDLGSGVDNAGSTDEPEPADSTSTPMNEECPSVTLILVPVAVAVFVIVVVTFALFLRRRFKMEAAVAEARKDDLYLDGSGAEQVPMPMFEEDVPSVLELEMEELDQWMMKDSTTAT